MIPSIKLSTIRDENTVSGSSEILREKIGFAFVTGSSGGYLASIKKDSASELKDILFDTSSFMFTTTDSIFPAIRVPVRLIGEPDSFRTDEEWKKYFIGGLFSEISYPGVYNENIYFDHNFKKTFGLPYLSDENNSITSPFKNNQIDIKTSYFSYYPQYQRYISNLDNITSLPSYYSVTGSIFETAPDQFSENTYVNADPYFNFDYPNSDTEEIERLKNILIEDYTDAISSDNRKPRLTSEAETDFINSDLFRLYSIMPFGNKIEISSIFLNQLGHGRNLNTKYKSFIENNLLEGHFLRLLKESFNGDLERSPVEQNFIQSIRQDVEIDEQSFLRDQVTTSTQNLRIIDLPTILIDSINKPFASNSDVSFIKTNESPVFDTEGLYRSKTTSNSFLLLNETNKNANTLINNINDFSDVFDNNKYSEHLAFRIEKLGGQPSGDNRNRSVLQNFWFFNKKDAMTFFDTQVKYNTQYTYKFYSYVLVEGVRYNTDTLRITRLIAQNETDSTEPAENCLEFYDPFTGITQQKLFMGDSLRDIFDYNQGIRLQINNKYRDIDDINDEINTKVNDLIISYQQYLSDILDDPLFSTTVSSNYYFFVILLTRFKGFDGPLNEYRFEVSDIPYYEDAKRLVEYVYTTDSLGPGSIVDSDYDIDETVLDSFKELIKYRPRTYALQMRPVIRQIIEIDLNKYIDNIIDTLENEVRPRLEEIETLQSEIESLNSLIRDFENELATDAQIFSSDRYMSDFYLNVEPSFKIIELPLGEKTVNIVDNPPVGLLVEPTYYKDGSKKLLFTLRKNVFSYDYEEYPSPLTELDIENKNNYTHGKDLLSTDKMKERSVSPERFVEVYRLIEKPTSYQDFFGSLRTTIDLKEEISGDLYGTALFEERVATNTKYYYTFRLINENGVSGPFTPIYESVLVDDGGYIYGDFVQLEESELIENRASKISIPIKKLLNIVPQQEHLEVNFADLDYSDTSLNQIAGASLGQNADDPVWVNGRKFKFRLTSKKTQKKVDINITFDYMTK